VTDDPTRLFGEWFQAAQATGMNLPEAAALSTATPHGVPSSRMVLLKAFDPSGFTFFTNYESRKAREMEVNPRAALLFFWSLLERQVRIEGTVARTTPEESAAYFRTRDRGSQLGAWASLQSRPLAERRELEERFQEHERRFTGLDVPLPPHWGGYRLTPERMEFWQGRPNRLHDRVQFARDRAGRWVSSRMYP